MKRLPTEWQKIFANDIYDKGLISSVNKEHIQLGIKKKKKPNPNNLIEKWTEYLNRYFYKEGVTELMGT